MIINPMVADPLKQKPLNLNQETPELKSQRYIPKMGNDDDQNNVSVN